jgi:uncharacterized membrane protein YfcA
LSIYLPIADTAINVFVLIGLGAGVGFLSGVFGVGGGFLMTPFLIFLGIPPVVAVGSQVNQLIATSVSGVMAHMRRGTVDFRMGIILALGGFVGSTIGLVLFTMLKRIGQVDIVIALSYVLFLGTIGGLMMVESIRSLRRRQRGGIRKTHKHYGYARLPWRMRFPRSRLYISVIPVIGVGLGVGLLVSIMGVGGGFILVPAMIYILEMPTNVVVGTSLFQIVLVAANVTFLQSIELQSVDVIIALLLLAGGVVGAQYGTRLGARLSGEILRMLLAAIVIAVGVAMAVRLVAVPEDLYEIETSNIQLAPGFVIAG